MNTSARIVVAVAASLHAACTQSQTFVPLINPEDPAGGFAAAAISGDGSLVGGSSLSSPDGGAYVDPFYWTADAGFYNFSADDMHGGSRYEVAAISGDARAIGGTFALSTGLHPYIYTQDNGFTRIDSRPGTSNFITLSDINHDGTAAVGTDTSFSGSRPQSAYRWTDAGGFQTIGSLNSGGSSEGYGITSDGTTVVGSSTTGQGITQVPMRWTEAGGMQALSTRVGRATTITPSGHVIGGTARFTNLLEAFLWTEETGAVPLDKLPSGNGESEVHAISDDGKVAVGWSRSGFFDLDWEAVVWTETEGIRKLSDILEDNFGIDMTGWQLISANDVSADGTTIVGTSIDPQGIRRGFVATIPAPATLPLIPITGLLTIRRRR